MPIIIQKVVEKTRTQWTQLLSLAFTFSVKYTQGHQMRKVPAGRKRRGHEQGPGRFSEKEKCTPTTP